MYKSTVVPISFEEDRDAAGALQIAKALRADDGVITLLHVMELVPVYATSYLPTDYQTDRRKEVTSALQELVNAHENINSAVVSGAPGRSITNWAEQNGSDCIVIASHRPGMQDLLLGSTATFVVRHAACAVHVIR